MIKAWSCNFTGPGSVPLVSAMAGASRSVFSHYQAWTRYTPVPGVTYAYTTGALWNDTNHSQVERLYLPMVLPTTPMVAGINQSDCLPSNLDLWGGRLDLTLLCNNLHLDKVVQLGVLGQWNDPEANLGRGSAVNYILRNPIDRALGFTASHSRGVSGEERDSAWLDVSVPLAASETAWVPIDGRVDKVAANVYGRSETVRQAMQCQLLNIQIVFYTGQQVPPREPFSKSGGGFGELYCSKAEVWVDEGLNPNAVEV